MQQFARRPDPEGQVPSEPVPLAPDSVAQLLDQITELARQVAAVKEEMAAIWAENERLRLQIVGKEATPAASRPQAAAEPAPAEVPRKPDHEKSAQEKIDEEFLVDLVRAQGVKETTAPSVVDTVLAIEKSSAGPMSDDDIQRMLAEAALGAFDAASGESAAPVTPNEDVPDNTPFLHLEEEPAQVEVPVVESFTVDLAVTSKVPSHLAIAALAVPHRIDGNKVVCKCALPFDRPALDILADAIACEVVPEPASMEDVLAALRRAYGEENAEVEKDYAWNTAAEAPKRKRGLFRRSA